ncbi:MAG: hypothetical protein HZB80_11705 [Deltaproteobacteria bacterium]|nr:hypothetical protein [Deltaproteobacteria bacterium]
MKIYLGYCKPSKIFGLLCVKYVIVLFVVFSPLFSEADELSDLRQKVERQQKEINELSHDLEKLEQVVGVNETTSIKPIFGANMGIFGDINFSTNSREKAKNSFYLGEIDLYSTGSYGDRLTFLSEIVIEGEENGFIIDVERLWAGYRFSDILMVMAGKEHTALGYWNKEYHHGKQLFLTVARPFFLNFEDEGGVIPMHITGLHFTGSWGDNFARFKYDINIGNGSHINHAKRELMSDDIRDENNSKAIVLRISARPNSVPNLAVGLSGADFRLDTSAKADVNERVYGIDIEYEHKGFEFVTEYFRLVNSDAVGNGFYAQLGYSIMENITLYARFESLETDRSDPYLNDLRGGIERRQTIAGVKYDVDAVHSSIKAQYRYDDAKDGNDYNVFELQWSFGF